MKEESIEKCKEIFQRAKINKCLPKNGTKDEQASQDARWIGTKKSAKQGKGKGLWYPELLQIAKEHGFPDAFETINLKTVKQFKELFKRSRIRGCLPKNGINKDKQERYDARKIANKRRKNVICLDILKSAKEYGFPNAFETISLKEKAINECVSVFKRSKIRGNLPKFDQGIRQEENDAQFINHRRRAKQGKGSSRWHPELLQIAKKYGFPNAFETRR